MAELLDIKNIKEKLLKEMEILNMFFLKEKPFIENSTDINNSNHILNESLKQNITKDSQNLSQYSQQRIYSPPTQQSTNQSSVHHQATNQSAVTTPTVSCSYSQKSSVIMSQGSDHPHIYHQNQHEPHNQFDGKPTALPGLTPTVRYQASCNEKWRKMELIDMENHR